MRRRFGVLGRLNLERGHLRSDRLYPCLGCILVSWNKSGFYVSRAVDSLTDAPVALSR